MKCCAKYDDSFFIIITTLGRMPKRYTVLDIRRQENQLTISAICAFTVKGLMQLISDKHKESTNLKTLPIRKSYMNYSQFSIPYNI